KTGGTFYTGYGNPPVNQMTNGGTYNAGSGNTPVNRSFMDDLYHHGRALFEVAQPNSEETLRLRQEREQIRREIEEDTRRYNEQLAASDERNRRTRIEEEAESQRRARERAEEDRKRNEAACKHVTAVRTEASQN
ncbi:hypothetical protein PENTCL1PPCAC_12748, partial [Pristionchus entomophagus]